MKTRATSIGCQRESSGFVLVIVLWVVAMLTVLTLTYAQRAILDVKAARYTLDHAQARMMARAAVHRGMLELEHKNANDAMDAANNPEAGLGVTHPGQSWAKPVNILEDGKYFDLGEDFKNDTATYIIEDLSGKIDINNVPDAFLDNFKLLDQGARRHINAQRKKHLEKQENKTYFQSLEEVRYLDGIKEKAWFGDNNTPGLRDVLTVYGDSDNKGKVNINTASLAVLSSLPGMDESNARLLFMRRGGDPSDPTSLGNTGITLQAAAELTEMDYDKLEQYCTTQSYYFKIKGVATRQGGKVRAYCTAVVKLERPHTFVVAWQEEVSGG